MHVPALSSQKRHFNSILAYVHEVSKEHPNHMQSQIAKKEPNKLIDTRKTLLKDGHPNYKIERRNEMFNKSTVQHTTHVLNIPDEMNE